MHDVTGVCPGMCTSPGIQTGTRLWLTGMLFSAGNEGCPPAFHPRFSKLPLTAQHAVFPRFVKREHPDLKHKGAPKQSLRLSGTHPPQARVLLCCCRNVCQLAVKLYSLSIPIPPQKRTFLRRLIGDLSGRAPAGCFLLCAPADICATSARSAL